MANDLIKPLKIESIASGGSANDMLPTEASPTGDLLAVGGLALSGSLNITVSYDTGGNVVFADQNQSSITLSQLRYAKGLDDATGIVDVSAAAAPTVGQILTATNSTTATWQSPLTTTNGEVDDAASTNITTTDAQISTMTVTPAAGTYIVFFNADFNSATSGIVVTIKTRIGGVDANQIKFMPFAGGTLTAGSQRVAAGVQDKVTVNGSQAIQIFASTSSGTVACANKSLLYVRIA